MNIDIDFDFRSDARGKDPDAHSPTLRRYHRDLWSKALPNGVHFNLGSTTPRVYLHHKSEAGEFFLSSDSVIPTFTRSTRIAQIVKQVPEAERDRFLTLSYSIGGMMIFPANKIGTAMTINGARGFEYRIKDRFDLTIECIRRHYSNEQSPLSSTLARYADFFGLFGDFRGYVEFFLLQDLAAESYSRVQFFLPFEDFRPWPLPNSIEEYQSYRQHAEAFIRARNQRVLKYAQGS